MFMAYIGGQLRAVEVDIIKRNDGVGLLLSLIQHVVEHVLQSKRTGYKQSTRRLPLHVSTIKLLALRLLRASRTCA